MIFVDNLRITCLPYLRIKPSSLELTKFRQVSMYWDTLPRPNDILQFIEVKMLVNEKPIYEHTWILSSMSNSLNNF